MKTVQYVIGLGFGDEGKGKTVQYLCKQAILNGKKPIVVRYCSGPQASHTVINNNISHVCSSFGSGVLLNVPTIIYYDTETLVDPIALHAEYDVLRNKGFNPTFIIDDKCNVITPYDVIANRQNAESLENGTCGCGVWESLNRERKYKLCLKDTLNNTQSVIDSVKEYHKLNTNIALESQFIKDVEFIRKHCVTHSECLAYMYQYDVIIMESSQGLLLDSERGFSPYTTPCKIFPIVYNNSIVFDYDKIQKTEKEIYFCTRTYTTRHGAGYTPRQSPYNIFTNKWETNKDNEYQGVFKTGILDIDIINRGLDRHCIDNIFNVKFNLVINHVDCIKDIFFFWKDDIINKCMFENLVKILSINIKLKFNKILWSDTLESKFYE